MKTRIMSVILAGVAFLFFHTVVNASYINPSDGYTNITTPDGYGTGTGWYGAQEDNEVEPPNAIANQYWDLEGFYFNEINNALALVGGFDFVNGVSGYPNIDTGDVFLETDSSNGWYDYVLDMNYATLTYDIVDIRNGGTFNQTSGGPSSTKDLFWSYNSGGTSIGSGFIGYTGMVTGAEMGGQLQGYKGNDMHNAAFVDLSFLAPNTSFGTFMTMTCGNDTMKGAGTTSGGQVPEPATILLLGFGVAALGARARKKKLDSAKEL